MLSKVFAVVINVGLALAASRTTAPSGALTVGSSGKYSTIQKAIDALSTTSTEAQSIFIEAGTYSEQVSISALKGPLTIYGYTENTESYADNKVIITHDLGLKDTTSDDKTATLRVETENFKMYNVDVVNSRGSGDIALALSAYVGNQGYYGCSFTSFQDTVLSESGYQVFATSLIVGATDFIFGQSASAWFTDCDIRLATADLGYVTASGRDSASSSSIYVLNKCSIAAESGATVPSGAFYLGRPWEPYARVVVQETSMTDVINSAGWSEWETSDPNTEYVTFEEYDNTGAGSEGKRASFAKKIDAAITIEAVLGDDYKTAKYVDVDYL